MHEEVSKIVEILYRVCKSMENYARCVQQERRTLKEMRTCMRLLTSLGEERTINDVITVNDNLKYSLAKIQGIRDILEKFVKIIR